MSRRVASAHFVGRQTELSIVDDLLSRATAGQPATLLIAGDAGVGKTRLVDELSARARAHGFVVLVGGCLELCEGGIPMAPIVEAVRRLRDQLDPAEFDDLLGETASELRFLVPDPTVEPDPKAARPSSGRVLELLLALVQRLAERHPTVLVSEDLHWADRSTLDLLSFLDRNLTGPVLLVGTIRSDELHRRHPLRPFLAEIERSGSTVRMDLAPFDRTELAAQAEAITGYAPRPDLLDDLVRRSEGNPFFAEELLAADAAHPDHLPDSLRDIVLGRVADLSDQERDVLRLASTLGVRVDDQLLRRLTELDDDELDLILRELVDAHLLIPERSIEGYRFRHALLQEAIYDELLPGERRRLHARIAEAIEGSDVDPITSAELAYHWYRARMVPEALGASVRAGRAAECVGAPAEAAKQYERAIELWDAVPDAEERAGVTHVDLLVLAAQAANVCGFFDRSIALLQVALDEVDADVDPATAGVLHDRMGHFLWGADQDALPESEEAVRLVPADPPSPERARVLAGYARLLMLVGDPGPALRAAQEAIDMAVAVGSREVEGDARNTLGTCLVPMGHVEEGLQELRRSWEIAEEIGQVEEVGRALVNLCHSLAYVGRWQELVELGPVGLELARRSGIDRTYGVFVEHNMLDGLLALGRWDEAAEREQSLTGRLPDGFWNYFVAGSLMADRGDFERAHESDGHWELLGSSASTLQGLPEVAASAAALAIWEGRPADVRPVVQAVLDHLPEDLLRCFGGGILWRGTWAEADLAVLARARQDDEAAGQSRTVAESFVEFLEAWVTRPSAEGVGRVAVMPVYLALAQGELARAGGADEPAHWERAVEVADRVETIFHGAYARFRLAEVLVRTGGSRAGRVDRAGRSAPPSRRPGCGPAPAADQRTGAASPSRPRRSGARPRRRGGGRRRRTSRRRGPAADAQSTRARGARPRGGRTYQPPDRRRAVHQPEDGQRPRLEHPGQAGRVEPRRGGRGRSPLGRVDSLSRAVGARVDPSTIGVVHPDHARRYAHRHAEVGDLAGDDGVGTDDDVTSDVRAGQHDHAVAEP